MRLQDTTNPKQTENQVTFTLAVPSLTGWWCYYRKTHHYQHTNAHKQTVWVCVFKFNCSHTAAAAAYNIEVVVNVHAGRTTTSEQKAAGRYQFPFQHTILAKSIKAPRKLLTYSSMKEEKEHVKGTSSLCRRQVPPQIRS